MSSDNRDLRSELRDRLARQIDSLADAVESDAPDMLVASCLNLVWMTAFVLMPEELTKARMDNDLELMRQRFAICGSCGERPIGCSESHAPFCGECEARLDAEAAEIDRELFEEG